MSMDYCWKYATGEKQSTWKKTCLNATLFTASTIWTGLDPRPQQWDSGD